MPLYFIPNEGQLDARVAYYLQGKDKTIYFASEGLTYVLNGRGVSDRNEPENPSRFALKLDFVGANTDVRPSGEERTGAVISYFKGKPEEWKAGLPTYAKILYKDLWPGIDLAYYGTVNKLKYEFIVHPGSDPSLIRLAYRGASAVEVNGEGRLEIKTPVGGFEDDVPVGYQERDGDRMDVELRYSLEEQAATQSFVYGFEVGAYDRTKPLVLDPTVLVYCGYIGGVNYDEGRGIAVDGAGNAYIIGVTYSTQTTFPVKVGPDLTFNGNWDAFVAKINTSSAALVYCGYIGGSGTDDGFGIAVDGYGNAYITGYAHSSETTFPVKVGPDLTFNGGDDDAFVAKVNASGTALVYCGYIGGSDNDGGRDIAVDGSGNAYITGLTYSTQTTFPVIGGPYRTFSGKCDAFVAKVNPAGAALVYCGYIGGSGTDYGNGIAVDHYGNAYITGPTESDPGTFPVKVGPDLTLNGGGWDAFVAEVDSTGTALVYCGYIGGSSIERGYGIAVDGAGNAYVTGSTESTETTFPVAVGPDLTRNGPVNAFVAKVGSTGAALVYCGYIGGSSLDYGFDIAVDGYGNAYITGEAMSSQTTFPVKIGPDLTFNGGATDAFVAKVDSTGAALVYCGYIGGSKIERGYGIAVDRAGNAYITGRTNSDQVTFPVKVGPDLTFNGGDWDVFVAKILEGGFTVTSPNGAETWKLNGSYNIKWKYSGSLGARVKIELLEGAQLSRTISGNAPIGANGRGSYKWKVPSSQTLGTNFKIRITSNKITSCTDTSDKYFKIVK